VINAQVDNPPPPEPSMVETPPVARSLPLKSCADAAALAAPSAATRLIAIHLRENIFINPHTLSALRTHRLPDARRRQMRDQSV
jgi:hypothetical protein